MLKTYILIISIMLCPCMSNAEEILVAVAANVQFAFEEIKTDYEMKNKISIKSVYGSSGKLATQIMNGAPFDIFLSANSEYPEVLYKKELTLNEPKIYAYGKLTICFNKDLDLTEFENCNSKESSATASKLYQKSRDSLHPNNKILYFPKVQESSATASQLSRKAEIPCIYHFLYFLKMQEIMSIAIADPKLAPYGTAAVKVFKMAGIYKDVSSKFVLGTSVAQVNHFLNMRSVDAGITSRSSYIANPNIGKYCIDVPETMYNPIAQASVVIKRSDNQEVLKFYNYIFQDQAKKVFRKYGYGT